MAKKKKEKPGIKVDTLVHGEAVRRNIPTAEYHSARADDKEDGPVRVAFKCRNCDLDPQLVWRGKDQQGLSELVVQAPPLYIQEKVHPKSLADDLLRQAGGRQAGKLDVPDLFADFNGLPSGVARTEFYQHDVNWSNRMILGDSLLVMASLAEREGLRGKVQCVYIDPPYGIKFNSNFQWSTTTSSVRDGKIEHITREPEQVKAFRDTWRDGVHSYLTYLRDRLIAARELLANSGSVFVQIGDENAHRVRALMDEVFGDENFIREIFFAKTGSLTSTFIGRTGDRILWYGKQSGMTKFRPLFEEKTPDQFYKHLETEPYTYRALEPRELSLPPSKIKGRIFQHVSTESDGSASIDTPFKFCGDVYRPNRACHWKAQYPDGMDRLARSGRLVVQGQKIRYRLYIDDYPVARISDVWSDTTGFFRAPGYVVYTRPKVVQRCILMTTDPGDLVLDPTCGSGTTAYVAEQWGRRWITIDTSRVALALVRARIMGACYPWYLLRDSEAGVRKDAELRQIPPREPELSRVREPLHRPDIRQGFVYERVPHVKLGSIAKNAEIDVIWEKWQNTLEPLRAHLNDALGEDWEEWQIPRETSRHWSASATQAHSEWWKARIARQREIEASIAAKAEQEYIYDKPHVDSLRIRVAGPFTVESLLPHRMLVEDDDETTFETPTSGKQTDCKETDDFTNMILDNLKVAGVQQVHKEDRITLESLVPWPGEYVCAEGHYVEGGGKTKATRRAGVFVGPEFGTVTRPDLVAAAREAMEADFDVLIACAFSYDARATEFPRLGRVPVLKARINADLHMAEELRNTGKGNLFVVFGEPDIEILQGDADSLQVRIRGVDIFHPNTGEIRSNGTDGIACWFIDTDYDEERFCVRHAYFLGAKDPYETLKKTLKAEIDTEAWGILNRDTSRPFTRPVSGRIAVKVINYLGDEAMKVMRV